MDNSDNGMDAALLNAAAERSFWLRTWTVVMTGAVFIVALFVYGWVRTTQLNNDHEQKLADKMVERDPFTLDRKLRLKQVPPFQDGPFPVPFPRQP